MNRIEIPLPKGWVELDLARTFAAYLIGDQAFVPRNGADHDPHGPFKVEVGGSHYKWQLDGSNDFWLRVEDAKIKLDWRYDPQRSTAEAMIALFKVRHVER